MNATAAKGAIGRTRVLFSDLLNLLLGSQLDAVRRSSLL